MAFLAAPDRTLAPYCGDGKVDSAMGEECDDGVNASLYGGCAEGCICGPRCGDGHVDEGEPCDAGDQNGTAECLENCTVDVPK